MLVVGASAPHTSLGGSLTFDVRISPSEASWDRGSASNSLLVRLLAPLLPLLVFLRLLWTVFCRGRIGVSVPLFIYIMLIAGAGAYDTSTKGGSFAFDMNTRLSDAWWAGGSAPCWWKCWR